MLSAQCDRLRNLAEQVEWELPEASKALRDAADTIWELRDRLTHWELHECPGCKNVADLQEALDENARLRELCAELLNMAESSNPEWLHWPEMHEELRKLVVKVVKL